jgi:hypothetical protein
MTIAATISQILYTGNGTTTQWSFANKIFTAVDLSVTIFDNIGGVWPFSNSTFQVTVGGVTYTYSLQSIDVDTGCVVTVTPAIPSTYKLDIRSNIAEIQSTSVKNQGSFYPELHEEFFDKATRMLQDLFRKTYTYGIHGPDTENTPWTQLPNATQRANTQLLFDVNGLPTIGTLVAGTISTSVLAPFLGLQQTPAEIAASVTPSILYYAELDPRRYGFLGNGVANDQPALATAILVAQQYNSARITLPQCSQNVLVNSGLSWDFNKVSIDLNGNTLDFSAMVSGHALTAINSNANQNVRVLLNHAHPLMNGVLKFASEATGAVDCLYINDGAITQIGGCKFRNLAFWNWSTDVTLGSGASFISFHSCTFTQTVGGSAITYSINQQNATNTGERTTFVDCTWYNKSYLINNQSTNGDMYFTGCSFDGFVRAFNGGNIYLNNCHIEVDTGGDADYWAMNSGPFPIVISNTDLVVGVSKTLDIFYSTSASINGGIFLNNVTLSPAGSISSCLIGGPGNAKASNIVFAQFGAKPPIALSLNQLAYPDFNSASYTDDWAFSGSAPPARTGTQSPTLGAAWSGVTAYVIGNVVSLGGTYYQCIQANTNQSPPNIAFWSVLRTVSSESLQFAGAVASTGFAKATRACQPGQFVVGRYYLLAPGLSGTGGIFNAVINFLDAAGNILNQIVTNTVSTTQAAWTLFSDGHQNPAPMGTTQCQMQFQLTNVTSGTPSIYLAYVDFTIV